MTCVTFSFTLSFNLIVGSMLSSLISMDANWSGVNSEAIMNLVEGLDVRHPFIPLVDS